MDFKKDSKIKSYRGLIAAPFTAFKFDGEVNLDILPKYVDHLVSQGVKGVFVNGTTGEGLSLTVAERKAIAEGWVSAGKNKLDLIIIQVGANSIKDAQELAEHAEKIGVDGIASLPPLFYKPQCAEHVIAYMKEISKSAPSLPLMLYHIPSFSGVEFNLSELLPKVRDAVPNFIGAKFTSTDVRDLQKIHNLPGEPFKILSGFEEVLLPCLSCGVTAAVGAVYSFMGSVSVRLMDAYYKGNLEEALKLQKQVLKAITKISKHGQPTACAKAVMNILGPINFGLPRVPLVPLSFEALSNLEKDLQELGADQWLKQ